MGHNRLGVLFKTGEWRAVVQMLDGSEIDPYVLAGAVLAASRLRFLAVRREPALGYCVWLLARIISASRTPGFDEELRRLGVETTPATSAIGFIAEVADRLDARLAVEPPIGHLGRIAALAVRQALTTSLVTPQQGLWRSSLDDVRNALAAHDTAAQFGRISRSFFGHFVGRSMLSFIDRELSQHVGETYAFHTVADGQRS